MKKLLASTVLALYGTLLHTKHQFPEIRLEDKSIVNWKATRPQDPIIWGKDKLFPANIILLQIFTENDCSDLVTKISKIIGYMPEDSFREISIAKKSEREISMTLIGDPNTNLNILPAINKHKITIKPAKKIKVDSFSRTHLA